MAWLALLAAGCGDPGLWERWRAERAVWRAQRLADRISIRPALADDAEWGRAAAAFEAVARDWPAARWLDPGAGRHGREVATIGLRARIAAGHVEFARGRADTAFARWASAERAAGALPAVAVEAATATAEGLEALGRPAAAAAAWQAVAIYPALAPEDGSALPGVLRAPLAAAEAWQRAGRAGARDSTLALGEALLSGALAAASRAEARAEVAGALARLRVARGDADGAAAAWREGIAVTASPGRRAAARLEAARAWLAAGRPDSARAWALQAAEDHAGSRLEGLRLEALTWEASGASEPALQAWARLIEAYPQAQDAVAEARFRRGAILERAGSWERARSELRTLAATYPTHPLAFEAQVRVVEHHARAEEADLARLEARRALETMDFLIATQHDDAVQRGAWRARAVLRVHVAPPDSARAGLEDVWRRWPGSPEGTDAAFRAADLAAGGPRGAERARALYRELAGRGATAADRERARAALGRLGG